MPHPTSVPVTDGVITGVVLNADLVLGRTGSDGVAGGAAAGASAGDGAVGAIVTANTGVDEVFKLTGSDMDGGAGAVGAPVDVDAGYEDGVDEGSEEPVDLVSPDAEEGFA